LQPGAESECSATEWLFCTHKGKGRSPKRPIFQWTGKLRPSPISPYRPVPVHIARPDYAYTGWPEEEIESRKQNSVHIHSAAEIAGIRAACVLGRRVLDAVAAAIRPGITTDELDRIAHEVTIAGGGYPSPLNYMSFPKSCCTSINEVICHGIPDARPLEDGDIVNPAVGALWARRLPRAPPPPTVPPAPHPSPLGAVSGARPKSRNCLWTPMCGGEAGDGVGTLGRACVLGLVGPHSSPRGAGNPGASTADPVVCRAAGDRRNRG
jgi:hypothetical protein